MKSRALIVTQTRKESNPLCEGQRGVRDSGFVICYAVWAMSACKPPPEPESGEKAACRARLSQWRAALPAERRSEYSRLIAQRLLGLAEIRSAHSLFVYVSHGAEVHTHELIRHWLAQRRVVGVPCLPDGRGDMRAVRLRRWEDLQPGRFGILAPREAREPMEAPDVSITPGLGFTVTGQRLGLGAGYYDRWFAAHPGTRRIALAFEGQLVESLPLHADDAPVHAIVTERRVYQVAHVPVFDVN